MPSGCFSIIGPRDKVTFNDAAILWASFYHLVFTLNEQRMKRREIRPILERLSRLFDVPVAYASEGRNEFEVLA